MRPKARVTDEEVKKNFVVFDTDFYTLRWNRKAMEDFAAKVQKLVDHRKDWTSVVYQEVMKRMKFKVARGAGIVLEKVDYTETVLEFADDWKKRVKLNETPAQKTIAEVTTEPVKAKKGGIHIFKGKKK